jgi:phage antirepressor YoqD-like protein
MSSFFPVPADGAASPAVTMSSIELVDFINSQRNPDESELRHDHFMAKVPKVLGEAAPKFLGTATYANGTGAKVLRQIYDVPKREACLMAMSYSYELQAKVFDRMTELEARNPSPLPQTFSQALRLAAEQAEKIESQAKALEIAAPKVRFVDFYVESTGLKGFREVCKLLKANESRFREFLVDSKIMYRLGGALTAYQNHIDAGRFEVKAGMAINSDHAYQSCKFTPKGVEWIAGEWAKSNIRNEGV